MSRRSENPNAVVNALRQSLVDSGLYTEEEIDRLLAIEPQANPVRGPMLEELLTGPVNDGFLANPVRSETSEALQRALESDLLPDTRRAKIEEELANRARIAEMGFLEQLRDAEGRRRMGSSALKGPGQTLNGIVNVLPGLVGVGLSNIGDPSKHTLDEDHTWLDYLNRDNVAALLQRMGTRNLQQANVVNQNINNAFGSSDALNPSESIMEAVSSLAVPGGLSTKALSFGGDVFADQLVRDMTDSADDPYKTVLDRLGVVENIEVSPLFGVAAAITAGSLTPAAFKHLSQAMKHTPIKNIGPIGPPPTATRAVTDLRPDGTVGLRTIETVNDEMTAAYYSTAEAVTNMSRRAGVPDPEAVNIRMNTETGSAQSARIGEAVTTGHFSFHGNSYRVDQPVIAIVKAYERLMPEVKDAVSKYLLLHDQMDDFLIAIKGNQKGNFATAFAQANQMARRLEQQFPEVTVFKRQYEQHTRALRRFMENNIISTKTRQEWDVDRPNYVPHSRSSGTRNQPFLERLAHIREDSRYGRRQDAFLETRELTDYVNIEGRTDPIYALGQYTHDILQFGMNNDLRRFIIEQWRNNTRGEDFVIDAAQPGQKGSNAPPPGPSTVTYYEPDGTKVTANVSAGLADMLSFAPNVAQYPFLYIPRRIRENFMIGPASTLIGGAFQGVSALRDVIGAPVTRMPGTVVGGLTDLPGAVVKQTYAKAARSLSNVLEASMLDPNYNRFLNMVPEQQRRAWAQIARDAYENSLYALGQRSGGLNASDMTAAYTTGKQVMRAAVEAYAESMNSNKFTRAVRDYGIEPVLTGWQYWSAFYDSVIDSPRFATFEKTYQSGVDPFTAAFRARNITGDTSRSGRFRGEDGQHIQFDTIDRPAAALAGRAARRVTEPVMEGSVFMHPMIAGNMRLWESLRNDPIGTNIRAWKHVVLPSIMAYAWNEMLGEEYNKHAFEMRSADEQSMYISIGLPGLDPYRSFPLPIPHELAIYAAPIPKMLDAMMSGVPAEERREIFTSMVKNIGGQVAGIDMPVVFNMGAGAMGVTSPGMTERIMGASPYERRLQYDGYAGIVEGITQELFGATADVAFTMAQILSNDWENADIMEAATSELWDQWRSNNQLTSDGTGHGKPNLWFNPLNREVQLKLDTIAETKKLWDELFHPRRTRAERQNGILSPTLITGLPTADRSEAFPEIKDPNSNLSGEFGFDPTDDMPFAMPGTPPLAPKNPLWFVFGHRMFDAANMNDLNRRAQSYGKYFNRLRDYHQGRSDYMEELTAAIMAVDLDDPSAHLEDKQMKMWLTEYDLDLTNQRDRVQAMNIINAHLHEVNKARASQLEEAEAEITDMLRRTGLIGPDQSFDVTKHLDPYDDSPLGFDRRAVIQLMGATKDEELRNLLFGNFIAPKSAPITSRLGGD
jgi:hypothetical protein